VIRGAARPVARWLAFLTVAVAIVAVAVVAASGAEAAGHELVEVDVAALDGILEEGGQVAFDVRVTNRGEVPVDDLRVRLTVHERTRSRYALTSALDEGVLGHVVGVTEADGAELDADSDVVLRPRASRADLGLHDAHPGVYPLTLSVLTAEGVAQEVVTAIVLPSDNGEPLRLAVLLDLQGPVATRRDGLATGALRESIERTNATVDDLQTPMPVTVAIDGRTVEELRAAAQGARSEDALAAAGALDALTAVTERPETEVVPYPYGPADLVALVRAGMRGEAQHLTDLGQRIAGELSGGSNGPAVLVPPAGLDADTAGWLSGVVDTTVLTEADLGLSLRRDMPTTPAAVRALAGLPELSVAVPDPFITAALARDAHGTEPSLSAQRVLAESAATFFERPGMETPRGLVVAVPLERTPGVVPAIAAQLGEASWLEPVQLSRLVEDVAAASPSETLSYSSQQQAAELPPRYLDGIVDARDHVAHLRGLLDEDDMLHVDRTLDVASAVGFRGAALRAHGQDIVQLPIERWADIRGTVSVLEGPPLTLTGTEGTVPVTLRSSADEQLRVVVRVLTTRYQVGDGGRREIVLPPGEDVTTTFEVRALAPGGTYPVMIEVTDPDVQLAFATGQVLVRSPAFNVAGLAVTGGAALVLVAWGLHGLARRRGGATDQRQETEPQHPAEPPEEPRHAPGDTRSAQGRHDR
jgi:hypothetical protein